ncbi:imidazole glycerol phosphate synthase cyclase subunit [Woeseiaceae bacterium]|nr:imidazole glycerol phosphate synthase cyclase subunit [Woeseiaceae bacterium]
MKKNRVIPVLLLKNGWLVQSREFSRHQNLGNPIDAVKRLSKWASDELIYLDISRDDLYDIRRDDQGYRNINSFLGIIESISKEVFMPMTIGGKIKNLHDIEKRLLLGADKISINTEAYKNNSLIEDAAKEFGSQCIIVSMDVKQNENGYSVFTNFGKNDTGHDPLYWSKRMESSGAGEILLNSIDRDGTGIGYDIELLDQISSKCKCPIIALGGVGEWSHFKEALEKTSVDSVAAANIFQYTDQSVFLAKKYLAKKGCNVRKPDLLKL